jgi:hypothetical protein
MARKRSLGPVEPYDFDRFIAEIEDFAFREAYNALDGEVTQVEKLLSARHSKAAEAAGGRRYVARLKQVGFWFHTGSLGAGKELAACRRLAIKFYANGQLKPEALTNLGLSAPMNGRAGTPKKEGFD